MWRGKSALGEVIIRLLHLISIPTQSRNRDRRRIAEHDLYFASGYGSAN